MAPPSKGTNPAPNYTVAMNQVQTQIEAQLRIVRSFMPARPAAADSTTSKPTPSFSALASGKPTVRRQTQKQDEEALFTETRAEDPNAGLGFGASSKRTSEREKERANHILRSRLLGRKRGVEDASGRALRREESSDEEPGRSGLGRAKKRARREESREEEEEGTLQPIIGPKVLESELEKVGAKEDSLENDKLEEEDGDVNMRDTQGTTSLHDDSVPNGAEDAPEQKKNKKRKKKKKKKAKSEDAAGE
ncbi:hypothetical protein E0Z10_g3552 [Xylaria hypoxylon]|uniref:Uncharacterized protein n=1 Tax=Xylaria hypoxylon TaxID=37992 RepID=A0A4Z0YMV3_9PEZI|nr:hypothetical protein E0Z10_g3552 [Xylaria hypoxylon]